MKKYIAIVSLLGLLFSVESYADVNGGLNKANDVVTQTDNVNSTLERATGVLERFGSVFKKKKKDTYESTPTTDNSSNQQSTDEVKEKVKESAKLQNEDNSSDKE